jgi:uncharacterized protein (TIGR02145 family)
LQSQVTILQNEISELKQLLLPRITTDRVESISPDSATIFYTHYLGVTYLDGWDSGVVWSTSTNPGINSATTSYLSSGEPLTGLTPNTTYHIRAFLQNNFGTFYGQELTFTTLSIEVPTLTTTEVSNITSPTATTGGIITSNGGANVTARGLVWSTSPSPTTALATKTTDGTGTGTFTSTLTGLASATTYYVRAYATNAAGTAYGTEVSFTTNAVAVLPSVTIGTQVWQSSNLDLATYRDGTPIPQVTDPTAWANLTTGAWCYYNNDPANGAIYGKLYNWYAVAGIHDNDPNTPNKILAPQGWHIPNDAEWTMLTTFLGGESVAGGKMKAMGTSLWRSPNTGATNSSGFTGLPGGDRTKFGTFDFIGNYGYWWGSSEYSTSNAWSRSLSPGNGSAYRTNYIKIYGFSVRCLRD